MPPLSSASGASFMGQSNASVEPHEPLSPSQRVSSPAHSALLATEHERIHWETNIGGHNAIAARNGFTAMDQPFDPPFGASPEIPSMAQPQMEAQTAVGVSEPGPTHPPAAATDPEAALEALQKNRACRDAMLAVFARIQERVDANAVLQRKVKLLIKASREAAGKPKEVDVGVRTANLDWPGRKKLERTRTSCSRIFVGLDGTGPEENPDIDRAQPLRDVLASCARERRWTDGEKQKLGAAMRTFVKEQWTKEFMAELQSASGGLSSLNDGLAQLKARHVTDADLEAALPRVNWEHVRTLAQLGGRTPEDCRACWTVQCAPGINRGEWTAEEDRRLRELVAKHEGHDWESVAEDLANGRTASACLVRFQRDLRTEAQQSSGGTTAETRATPTPDADGRPGSTQLWPSPGRPSKPKSAMRKQAWTEEENLRLRYAVAAFGTSSWVHVAEIVGTRTDPQCRERWMNVLDPSLDSSPWTEEETARLEALMRRLGAGKWAQLAEEFNDGRLRKRTDDRLRKHYEALVAKKSIQPVPVSPSQNTASHLQLAIFADPRAAKLVRRREAAQAREAKKKSAIVPRESTPAAEPQLVAPVVQPGGTVAIETGRTRFETAGFDVLENGAIRSEPIESDPTQNNAPGTGTGRSVPDRVETPLYAAPKKKVTRLKLTSKGGKKAATARKASAGIRKTGKSRLARPLGLGPRPHQQPIRTPVLPVVDPGLFTVYRMLQAKKLQPTHVGNIGKPAAVVHGRRVHFMQRHAHPGVPVARPTFPSQTPPRVSTTAIIGDRIAVARAKGPPKKAASVPPSRPQRTPEERRARKRELDKKYRLKKREQRAAAQEPTKEGATQTEVPPAVQKAKGAKVLKKRKGGEQSGEAGAQAADASTAEGEIVATEGGREGADEGGERDGAAATPSVDPGAKPKLTDEQRARKNEKARRRWAESRAQREAAKAAGGADAAESAAAGSTTGKAGGKEGQSGKGKDAESRRAKQAKRNEERLLLGDTTKTDKKRRAGIERAQRKAQKEMMQAEKREQRAAEKEEKRRRKAEERAAKTAVKSARTAVKTAKTAVKTAKIASKKTGKGPLKGAKSSLPQRRVTKATTRVKGVGRAGSQRTNGPKATVQTKATSVGVTRGDRGAARRGKSGRGKDAAVRVAPSESTKRGAKNRTEKGGAGRAVSASPGERVSGRLRAAALGKGAVGGERPVGEPEQGDESEARGGRKRAGGAGTAEGKPSKKRKTEGVGEAGEGMPRPRENENGEKCTEREGMRTRKRPREDLGREEGETGDTCRKSAKGKVGGYERKGKKARVAEVSELEVEDTETNGMGEEIARERQGGARGKRDRGRKINTEEGSEVLVVLSPVPTGRGETRQGMRARIEEKETAEEMDGKRLGKGGGSPMITRRVSRGGVPPEESPGGATKAKDDPSERPRRSRRISDKEGERESAEVDLLDPPSSGEEARAERRGCPAAEDGTDRRVTSCGKTSIVESKARGKKRAADEMGHVAQGEESQGKRGKRHAATKRKAVASEEEHSGKSLERRGGRAAADKQETIPRAGRNNGEEAGRKGRIADGAKPVLGGSPLRRSARGSKRKA